MRLLSGLIAPVAIMPIIIGRGTTHRAFRCTADNKLSG